MSMPDPDEHEVDAAIASLLHADLDEREAQRVEMNRMLMRQAADDREIARLAVSARKHKRAAENAKWEARMWRGAFFWGLAALALILAVIFH